MNQYKTSRSTNDALSLPALKGGVSRAKAMKDYGADELDIVHIVIEIEKAFDISIYDESVYIIDSLSELEKLVYSKIF